MLNGYSYWGLLYMSLDIKMLLFVLVAVIVAIADVIYLKKTKQFYE